ncbi:hypothetical protein BC829DRAFT_378241 [Chytridium lagenaria]|nr:hypothetical protein BC829DRAFT_378241 [Chytridium lagenaria]
MRVLGLLPLFALACWAESPSVHVKLEEFVAVKNRSLAHPWISLLHSKRLLDVNLEDSEIYQKSLVLFDDFGKQHAGAKDIDMTLYNLALSSHYHAPAVESLFNYYDDYVKPAYPHCSGEHGSCFTPTFLSNDFPKFHNALLELTKTSKLCYVLRYVPVRTSSKHTSLGGYGVELAIKSTEYTVIDDRQQGSAVNDGDFEQTHTNFLDIGLKLNQIVLTSENKLKTLHMLTRDFPLYASSITKFKLDPKKVKTTDLKSAETPPGVNKLYLNGLEIETDRLDFFRMMRVMDGELKSLSYFSDLGLPASDVLNLFSASFDEVSTFTWGETFDVRAASVLWWNDLEKDKKYRMWPKSIREVLRPSYSSQLRYIRKNLFNVVLILDLSNPEHLKSMIEVFDFIDREVPLRFGLIPAVDLEGDNAPSSVAASAFKWLVEKQGRKPAKSFIAELAHQLKGPQESVNDVIVQSFKSISGKEFEDIKSETAVALSELRDCNIALGVNLQIGAVFFNGRYISLDERWPQAMLMIYPHMLEFYQSKVYLGLLNDKTDPYEYLMTTPGVFKRRNPLIFPSEKKSPLQINFLDKFWKPVALDRLPYVFAENAETFEALTQLLNLLDFIQKTRICLIPEGPSSVAKIFETSSGRGLTKAEIQDLKHHVERISIDQASELNGNVAEFRTLLRSNLRAWPISAENILTPEDLEIFINLEFKNILKSAEGVFSKMNIRKTPTVTTNQQGHSSVFEDDKGTRVNADVLSLWTQNREYFGDKETSKLSFYCITDLPIKRFYRFVLSDKSLVNFGTENSGVFRKLPKGSLLTMGIDAPKGWVVRPVESVEDLDNIKLASVESTGRSRVDALYQLRNILVEGHVQEHRTNMPPLVCNNNSVDTITMTNLGYIQLKANPGIWKLALRDGRSREIFSLAGWGRSGRSDATTIAVRNFEGVTVFPLVKRHAGKEGQDVLEPTPDDAASPDLWNRLKTTAVVNGSSDEIHIFSVASGHLYERFMAIMMASVMKQTKSKVKFWLIENFLSPSFMKFIPVLAEAYGFNYELITYKWPHWLRGQTEKQRTIWGYKILFLDVLFPLNLEKVIFVDADQIVRTDLKELMDLDLQGAVYGYTPFCDSRTEMDGFRFWNSGYWKNQLAGRPYHISALYVIDLKRFRQFAAGDRLRQQYQMLSADPGSLANLDQDLPNSMIHQIPMFSLPQEWLWCETWCSDKELEKAKTIDLCNNPLTKEPKLERARRLIPEWDGLDKEIQALSRAVEEKDGDRSKPDIKNHDEL